MSHVSFCLRPRLGLGVALMTRSCLCSSWPCAHVPTYQCTRNNNFSKPCPPVRMHACMHAACMAEGLLRVHGYMACCARAWQRHACPAAHACAPVKQKSPHLESDGIVRPIHSACTRTASRRHDKSARLCPATLVQPNAGTSKPRHARASNGTHAAPFTN